MILAWASPFINVYVTRLDRKPLVYITMFIDIRVIIFIVYEKTTWDKLVTWSQLRDHIIIECSSR